MRRFWLSAVVFLFGINASASDEVLLESSADEPVSSPFGLNFSSILYGPGVGSISSQQPRIFEASDPNSPIYSKNFLNTSYALSPDLSVIATVYWHYRPVQGQSLELQDPSIRVAHSSLYHTENGLNLYADARIHFGLSSGSRANDLLAGVQSFQYLTFPLVMSPDEEQTRGLSGALRVSERRNFFGPEGEGSDVEFYLAPELLFHLNSDLSLNAFYEAGTNHVFGAPGNQWSNDGNDLVTGVSWDITPSLYLNPYLIFQVGSAFSWSKTALGGFVSWKLF